MISQEIIRAVQGFYGKSFLLLSLFTQCALGMHPQCVDDSRAPAAEMPQTRTTAMTTMGSDDNHGNNCAHAP
jgi:hypothetical protein